jgi:hypothetical protein
VVTVKVFFDIYNKTEEPTRITRSTDKGDLRLTTTTVKNIKVQDSTTNFYSTFILFFIEYEIHKLVKIL